MKNLRGLVTKLVIASFSIAAVLGIIALIGGGEFGDTEANILLTTAIVGVESLAVLCYLSVAEHPAWLVGVLGGAVSLVPVGISLWLIWADLSDADDLWQWFGAGVTIAGSLAQVCLLLALVGRHRIRPALVATFVAIAVVAGLIIVAIFDGSGLGDTYSRVFGVVAILDVLGTVVLSALAAYGRGRPSAEPDLLTTAVESRVIDAAAKRGMNPSELISQALDDFLR